MRVILFLRKTRVSISLLNEKYPLINKKNGTPSRPRKNARQVDRLFKTDMGGGNFLTHCICRPGMVKNHEQACDDTKDI